MNENEQLELEVENKLAYVLAKAYTLIPWSKIKVNNAHKFFMERIRASSNTRTFKIRYNMRRIIHILPFYGGGKNNGKRTCLHVWL